MSRILHNFFTIAWGIPILFIDLDITILMIVPITDCSCLYQKNIIYHSFLSSGSKVVEWTPQDWKNF